MFPHEDACCAYLVARRWPDGVRCPRCGAENPHKLPNRPWSWQCYKCAPESSVLTLNCHHIIHAASALSRATRARLILERILAPSPQQNDVGAFLVSRTDGDRPRPATKFFRDIPLRVQSLDGPRHPSNPPPNQIARQILVDICDPGH